MREYLLSGGRSRQHLDAKAGRNQSSQNVQLDSVVERDNRRRIARHFVADVPAPQFPVAEVPIVGLGGGNFFHEIAADESWRRLGLAEERIRIEIDARYDSFLCAARAEMADKGARVDTFDTD